MLRVRRRRRQVCQRCFGSPEVRVMWNQCGCPGSPHLLKHWNAACVWLKISGKGWKRNQGLRLQERLSLIPRKRFDHALSPGIVVLAFLFSKCRYTPCDFFKSFVKFCEWSCECSGCSFAFPFRPCTRSKHRMTTERPMSSRWPLGYNLTHVKTQHMSWDMSWDMLILRQNERHAWTWDKLRQVETSVSSLIWSWSPVRMLPQADLASDMRNPTKHLRAKASWTAC